MQPTPPVRDIRSRRDELKNVGIAFVVCSLILAVGLFTRRDGAELTLEMASTTASIAQVFYDTGAGFREIESRTAPVPGGGLDHFTKITFGLPDGVQRLRFDPLTTAGTIVIRNVELPAPGGTLRIDPGEIRALNQIASRSPTGREVTFTTAADANDASLLFARDVGTELTHMKRRRALRKFLLCLPVLAAGALLVLWLYAQLASDGVAGRTFRDIHARLEATADRISVPGFIEFDAYALWFYLACGCGFVAAGLANLNGSSAGMFSSVYGHGAKQPILIGAPRAIRSDEWAYVTPDILNQSLRAARFRASDSELGNHFAALAGNIPVKHISTLFRPQLWPFFVLPVDYAFAFHWQFKGLILLTGVFTWLLLMTRSTGWAAVGSVSYFFSPFMQWSYSWPSALPEMIGSICLAMVLACFLTVGRNAVALALAAVGLAACSVNFAMCAYPPHLVPLFWLAVFFFAGWLVAQRQRIFTRAAAGRRAFALLGAVVVTAGVGLCVYRDMHAAIVAIANTLYPGKRMYSGGLYPFFAMGSHFLAWTERETRFPPILGNISEGSGFLWLAPVTLLCITRMRMTREQKFYWLAIWAAFCFLLAWLVLPIPGPVGALFGLQETAAARMLPAVGLANVAIVALCMASLPDDRAAASRTTELVEVGMRAALATAVMFLVLGKTNQKLEAFFSQKEVLLGALLAGILIALMMSRRKTAFALWLVLPQVILFGAVNPLERGLQVFTSSKLLTFVRQHPELRQGKWIMFSDSVVNSGFLAATGCEVYTGTRYVPDTDHFGLFAANHYDIDRLNRDGYLTAHLLRPGERAQIELPNPVDMQWDVTPSDPIIKQLGITYVASDQPIPAPAIAQLIPLAPEAVDGFWLYRLK